MVVVTTPAVAAVNIAVEATVVLGQVEAVPLTAIVQLARRKFLPAFPLGCLKKVLFDF